jgi:hypothetical protein
MKFQNQEEITELKVYEHSIDVSVLFRSSRIVTHSLLICDRSTSGWPLKVAVGQEK